MVPDGSLAEQAFYRLSCLEQAEHLAPSQRSEVWSMP